jgi:AcrR family transcriptional regulator
MTTTTTRSGGRSARVTAAVHDAVVGLLAEGEPGSLTIPRVAARAGVNPTSVYRRWGDVPALLADTAAWRFGTTTTLPDTGDLRGDLVAWGGSLLAELGRPDQVALLRAAVGVGPAPAAEPDQGSACTACVRWRSEHADAIVAAAQARGEAAPSASEIIDHLVAPLHFRVLFGLPAAGTDVVERLVAHLLAAATGHGSRSAAPEAGPSRVG